MSAVVGDVPWEVRHDLGLATLWFALRDQNRRVCEDLGRNDGTVIREYASHFGLTPPLAWCAVSFSAWLRAASSLTGIQSPLEGSPAARGVEAQFIQAGLWVPSSKLNPEVLVPGNVPIWWRGKDELDWPGHIGVISGMSGVNMLVVEANSGKLGEEVAVMTRSIMAPRLLGVGVLRGKRIRHEFHEPTDEELERAGQLVGLSRELMRQGEPDDPLADLNARLAREGTDDEGTE
jgi:hypothetical protein